MKKILALASFLLIVTACNNQPATTNTTTPSTPATKSAAPSEADAIANEKAIWDTLKKKDLVAFGNMLASDYLEIGDDGVFDKAAIIADVANLDLTEATFSDWKMLPIDNDAVLLTYNTQLKGTFKGQAIPAGTFRSAALWVNRDGKWQDFFYQQTLSKTGPPPPAAAAKSEKATTTPPGKHAEAGSDPIANEKIVWDYFKSKDYDGFASLLDPAFVEIEDTGVYDKAAAVKASEFDATMFGLSEWKAAKIDNDAALVTYLVKPTDAKMDSQRHTTIWANRGGKWVALLHIGTTVAKAPAAKPEAKKM